MALPPKQSRSSVHTCLSGYWHAQPVPWFDVTVRNLTMVAAYVCLNLFAYFVTDNRYDHKTNVGYLAAGNSVVLLLPALRNGLSKALLGWSFDQVIGMHRWLGRGTIFLVTVHACLAIRDWEVTLRADWTSQAMRDQIFHDNKYLYGFLGWMTSLLLLVTSFRWIRRNHWNTFMLTHLLYVVFYAFAYLHTPDGK